MTTRKPLGIGVISLGWMGRLHSRAYTNVTKHFPGLEVAPRLVAAADPSPQTRESALDILGFERAYEDYRELLADPEVDAVSIASPNFLHHKIALAAIEAGKPFWIEKPMGVNAAQSRKIALAAQKAGLVSAVGFTYRHTPAIEYMRPSCARARWVASRTCACGSSPTTTPPRSEPSRGARRARRPAPASYPI